MNTDRLTSVLGGAYGMDQLVTNVSQLLSDFSVERLIHTIAAACLVGWAIYTNKR